MSGRAGAGKAERLAERDRLARERAMARNKVRQDALGREAAAAEAAKREKLQLMTERDRLIQVRRGRSPWRDYNSIILLASPLHPY